MKRALIAILGLLSLSVCAEPSTWTSDSKDFGESRSDFLMREVDRRPRSSVVQLEIKNLGGSVGSSMIISCMLMRLAEERGGYRYIVKVDARSGNPDQMLVGFAHQAGEKPQSIDPELPASAMEVDLNVFGPEMNQMCRKKKEEKTPQ